MQYLLNIYDLLLPPIYLLVIYYLAKNFENRKKIYQPEYTYFTNGLMIRIVGAFSLGLIYFFYYDGGDTTNYYQTAEVFVKLFFKNTEFFFDALTNKDKVATWSYFDENTGFPEYKRQDDYTYFVVKLMIPIVFISGGSYFTSAIITATITYFGIWKLYQVFISEYPSAKKLLAFGVLFFPSCVFWGSGIMKDSFTLSAIGWYTYGFYNLIIKKKYKINYISQLLISSFVILSIKPYVFLALLPGSLIWFGNDTAVKIKVAFFKLLFTPLLLAFSIGLSYFLITKLSDGLNSYNLDSIFERATVVQKDMKAEYYGGKTFDIGEFEPTLAGVLGKTPIAVYSGLFRPAIWEVKNAVMLIAGLENIFLLSLTLFLLYKAGPSKIFKILKTSPLIYFAIIFSIIFSFSVGLTVANFGSLVRLRIPELPFFVSSILLLYHLTEQKSKNDNSIRIKEVVETN